MPLKVPMGFEMFGTERRNPQGPSSVITRRAWRETGPRPSLYARELAGVAAPVGPRLSLMETEAVLANEVGLRLLRKLREKVSAA
jgi:hypothetical protein